MLCATLIVKQCLLKKIFLSDIGTQGWKTSITVKTMNGEVTKSSEAMEDLELA